MVINQLFFSLIVGNGKSSFYFIFLKNYELLLKEELLKWCKSIFFPTFEPIYGPDSVFF